MYSHLNSKDVFILFRKLQFVMADSVDTLSRERKRELIIYGYLREIVNKLNGSKLVPMNDIFTVMIIYYNIQFKWSRVWMGDNIVLSEDESKASFVDGGDQSLRAEYSITKNAISTYLCTM